MEPSATLSGMEGTWLRKPSNIIELYAIETSHDVPSGLALEMHEQALPQIRMKLIPASKARPDARGK